MSARGPTAGRRRGSVAWSIPRGVGEAWGNASYGSLRVERGSVTRTGRESTGLSVRIVRGRGADGSPCAQGGRRAATSTTRRAAGGEFSGRPLRAAVRPAHRARLDE